MNSRIAKNNDCVVLAFMDCMNTLLAHRIAALWNWGKISFKEMLHVLACDYNSSSGEVYRQIPGAHWSTSLAECLRSRRVSDTISIYKLECTWKKKKNCVLTKCMHASTCAPPPPHRLAHAHTQAWAPTKAHGYIQRLQHQKISLLSSAYNYLLRHKLKQKDAQWTQRVG